MPEFDEIKHKMLSAVGGALHKLQALQAKAPQQQQQPPGAAAAAAPAPSFVAAPAEVPATAAGGSGWLSAMMVITLICALAGAVALVLMDRHEEFIQKARAAAEKAYAAAEEAYAAAEKYAAELQRAHRVDPKVGSSRTVPVAEPLPPPAPPTASAPDVVAAPAASDSAMTPGGARLGDTRVGGSYVQVGQTMAPLGGSYVEVDEPEAGSDFEMINRVKWHENTFTR